MRLLIRATLLALVASCFAPDEPDGALRCTAAGGCPGGFECRADRRCWRRGAAADPPQCSNGMDDDCDGKIDREDPGCSSPTDNDEHGNKRCDDGVDNDGDTLIDFHVAGCGPAGDPQCDKPEDDSED